MSRKERTAQVVASVLVTIFSPAVMLDRGATLAIFGVILGLSGIEANPETLVGAGALLLVVFGLFSLWLDGWRERVLADEGEDEGGGE